MRKGLLSVFQDETVTVKSSAPFVLIVSDLHMSDFTAGDDFILGSEKQPPFGNFIPSRSKSKLFEAMLCLTEKRAQKLGCKIELVLLGDIVDDWESAGRETHFGHQDFIEVINRFRERGNKVVFIYGNHDKNSVTIPRDHSGFYYINQNLRIYACHGHQADKYNKSHEGIGSWISQQFSRLEVQNLKKKGLIEYPFILFDNIKPFNSTALKKYYKWLKQRYPFLHLFSSFLFFDSIIISLLNFSENDSNYSKAAETLSLMLGYDIVVMGHTHIPAVSGRYYNTGSWTPVIPSLYIPESFEGKNFNPFLMVYKNTEFENLAKFYFWESGPNGFLTPLPRRISQRICNKIRNNLYQMKAI